MYVTATDCIEGVYRFNRIAGNLVNVDCDDLKAQCLLIDEEVKELNSAVFNDEGPEQILKETADNLVVLFGMVEMLESLGYDVYGAWKAVNDNNLSKYCTDTTQRDYTDDFYKQRGITLTWTQDEMTGVWVGKDENGKVRKPINYKPVCLKEYLPKENV